MNKADTADHLAARTGLNKVGARDADDSMFAVIGEALANGEKVRIAGFGTFSARTRPGRTGRNPKTGRGDLDIGIEVTVVQGGEGNQGCGERRPEVVTVGRP